MLLFVASSPKLIPAFKENVLRRISDCAHVRLKHTADYIFCTVDYVFGFAIIAKLSTAIIVVCEVLGGG